MFVLCTGRCGSRSLARALGHATNWSVGHESNVRTLNGRLDYPDRHIEVDNRLAFFLGRLVAEYPDAVWVHLTRDPDATAKSFARTSWNGKRGIMPAFAGRIVWADRVDHLAAARFYVDTQTANISEFLRHRPHIVIPLEDPHGPLDELWGRIDATGDREAAHAALRRS